jgi:phage gp45-like
MWDSRVAPQLLRVTVADIDDSGPQQFVHATGLAGQDIGRMVRSHPFGLSTVPPAGAEGHALVVGGGADRMFALGLEHPQYRPVNTPVGGTVLYGANGEIVSLIQQNIRIVCPGTITIQAANIKINGNVDVNS